MLTGGRRDVFMWRIDEPILGRAVPDLFVWDARRPPTDRFGQD